MIRSGLLGVVVAASCAGPPVDARATPPPPPHATVVALPAGTLLRLLPVAIVGAAEADDTAFASGVLREALRASARFDVAAGMEDTEAPLQVAAHLDADSGTLTTTLLAGDGPPTALAATPLVRERMAEALQALAAATLQALGDADPLPPVRALYSEARACVLATEAALAAASAGDLAAARGQIADARRADAGCTVTLLAAAELELRASDHARAARTAQDALQLASRCSPTTRHRLARVLLSARAASVHGAEALHLDQQLLALGEALLQERPHDPHGAWTRAQALALLGRFDEAEPVLAALRTRWPHVAQVPYHHGLALLGCARPDQALGALAEAQPRLSPLQTAIPRAIALWSAGQGAELTRFLADLAGRAEVQGSGLLHHVRRMQAAQAILDGRGDAAAGLLLADLEWLRQRASRMGQYAEHLASTAHVLVLLGHDAQVTRAVDAFLRLPHLDEAARRALTFAGGLAAVAHTRDAATVAEASLSQEGASAWSHTLRAASFRARGELAGETRALLEAAQLDRSPLLRAALGRALRAAGETERAEQLLRALRADLLRLDLRRLASHPLVDPAHALALLATG